MASSSWPLLRLGFAAIVVMMLFEGSFVGVSREDIATGEALLTEQEAVSAQPGSRRGLRQRLYVDGCLAALSTYAGPLPLVPDGVLIGGFSFGPYHHPWIGDLDEVSIYSRVLSAAEVGRSYKRHRPARRCP